MAVKKVVENKSWALQSIKAALQQIKELEEVIDISITSLNITKELPLIFSLIDVEQKVYEVDGGFKEKTQRQFDLMNHSAKKYC